MRAPLMRIILLAALAEAGVTPVTAQVEKPYLTVGLFLGRIEEGARIFTPARLLPLDHPEALGHDFPTVQQLHGTEFPTLLWLGSRTGLDLRATLQRYPVEPSPDWPYPGFRPPPDTTRLQRAVVVHRPRSDGTLPGLRAVLYDGGVPVLFIVDTRNLTLAERGMKAATTMGLDIGRREFLTALDQAARLVPGSGLRIIVFDD